MARERTFIIHPFDDIYDDFLNGPWNLLVQSQIASYLPGQHAVSTEQLQKLGAAPVSLIVSLDKELISEFCEVTKIPLSDLRLSVRTFSRFMNLSKIAYSQKLSEIDDLSAELAIALNTDAADLVNPVSACHTGFTIQVLVTLDKSRVVPATELVPKYRFTILAEDSFKLRPATGGGLGLQFFKLTPDVRRNENIPKQSPYYIKKIEKPWTVEKITDCAVIYVDSLLLEKANLLRNNKQGQRQFMEIHVEIIDSVLQDLANHLGSLDIVGQPRPTYESIRATVAGKVVNILHSKGNGVGADLDHDQLIAELADHPSRSRARALAALSHLETLLDAFDEEESQ